MADLDTTQLTATTTPANDDLLYTVVDPLVTPLDRKITWTSVKAFLKTYFDTLFSPIDYSNSMLRQAIINGNFDVWQRGTTVTKTDDTNEFLADRWLLGIAKDGGTLPTLTFSRQSFSSGELFGSRYFARLASDGTGTSLGNSSYNRIIQQKIEDGVRLLCGNGKTVTVSFWARSDIAGKKICPVLYQRYGTGGSPSAGEWLTGTPITLTSTLTKYTQTFTTNTLSGKTFGTTSPTDSSLDLFIYGQWGSTTAALIGATGAETYGNGYIDIAQVQICAGSVALPFQPKSYAEELRACQRYYEKSYAQSVAPAGSSNGFYGYAIRATSANSYEWLPPVRFQVVKRNSTPTVTVYSLTGAGGTVNDGKIRNRTTSADLTVAIDSGGDTGFGLLLNNQNVTAGDNIGWHYTAESEL